MKKEKNIKGKVKKLRKKKDKIKEFSLEMHSFLKIACCCGYLCFVFFSVFFLREYVKFKNNLRTIEPRFWKKIKNNRASF